MKRLTLIQICFLFFIFVIFVLLVYASTDTHYVTDSGAGLHDGTSLANAWSYSEFSNSSNWDTDEDDDNKVGPGDTVYLCDTFTHEVTLQGSGTSGHVITLRGDYSGHACTFSGGTRAIVADSKDFILIYKIDFTNQTAKSVYLTDCSNWTFQECDFLDESDQSEAVNLKTTSGGGGSNDIAFYDCTFDGHETGIYLNTWGNSGSSSDGRDGFIFDGCTMENIQEIGIQDWYDPSYHSLYSSTGGRYMGNVEITDSEFMDLGHNAFGIYLWNGSANLIARNRLTNIGDGHASTNAMQIHCARNLIIEKNVVDGVTSKSGAGDGHCCILDYDLTNDPDKYCDGVIVRFNLFRGATSQPDGSSGLNPYAAKNCVMIGNLLIENENGTEMHGSNRTGNKWYNNTIADNNNAGVLLWDEAALTEFINNIIANNGGSAFEIQSDATVPDEKHTVYYGNSSFSGGEFAPDATDINGNPDFVNAAADDYSLSSGSAAIDAGYDLGDSYQDLLDPDSDFTSTPPSISTLINEDYGEGPDIGAYVYQGGGENPPSGCNDLSLDPDVVAWYIFDENANDQNNQIGTYNLTTVGSPTINSKGSGCNGGIVLGESTPKFAYSSACNDITGDFSFYIEFTHAAVDDAEWDMLGGQYDTTNDARVWAARVYGSGGYDYFVFSKGTESGSDFVLYYSTYALTVSTKYRIVGTYDTSEETFVVEIYNTSGTSLSTETPTRENDSGSEVDSYESQEISVGIILDGTSAGDNEANCTIHEFALWNRVLTADERDELGAGEYGKPSLAVSTMKSVSGNITDIGTMTWAIGWNREPFTEGGAWTIDINLDYPAAAQTMSYTGKWNAGSGWTQHSGNIWKKTTYIEPDTVKEGTSLLTENDGNYGSLSADEWDWDSNILYVNVGGDPSENEITPSPWETYVAIDITYKWRQDSFGDGQISDNITKPDGVTITDAQQNDAIVTSALSGLGAYPSNTVGIWGIWYLGSAGDYPLWSNGSTGFDDLLFDVDYDRFNILEDINDNVTPSENYVTIRGTGRNVSVTGSCTVDNAIIRCITFSGGISGSGNTYQENCQGQLIE